MLLETQGSHGRSTVWNSVIAVIDLPLATVKHFYLLTFTPQIHLQQAEYLRRLGNDKEYIFLAKPKKLQNLL